MTWEDPVLGWQAGQTPAWGTLQYHRALGVGETTGPQPHCSNPVTSHWSPGEGILCFLRWPEVRDPTEAWGDLVSPCFLPLSGKCLCTSLGDLVTFRDAWRP